MSTSSLKTEEDVDSERGASLVAGDVFNGVIIKRVHNLWLFATKLWTQYVVRKDTLLFIHTHQTHPYNTHLLYSNRLPPIYEGLLLHPALVFHNI